MGKSGGKWNIFVTLRRIYKTKKTKVLQFLGNIEAKVDSKGRVFIPSVFRKRLQSADESFLALRKDIFQDCLVLYPGTVWEAEIQALRSRLNKWNSEQQQVFRQFVLDAERLDMDANGRVLIPKRYMQMVGIEGDIRFLGVDNAIEIWAKERLEQPLVAPEEFSAKLQRLMG